MQYVNVFKGLESGEKYIVFGMLLVFILGGFGDLPPLFGLIFMTVGIIKVIMNKGYQEIRVTPLTRPLILILLIAVFSLINIISLRSAFNMLGTMLEIVLGFFITYYIFKNKSEQFHQKMLFFLFLGGTITALYGVYEGIFIDPRRLQSVIGNSNLLGVYMMFFVFLVLILFYKKNYKLWTAGSILFLLFGYNLLYALSLSAVVGTILGFFFFFVLKSKKLLLVFIIMLMLSPLILPEPLTGRMESAYDKTRAGNYQRPYVYQSAYEMFANNLVLGVGIGHFREYYPDYLDPEAPNQSRVYNHTHNIFLQFMSELGLAGLLAFLYLIIMIVKTVYKALPFAPDFKGNLCLLFTSAFFGFFFQEQTEFSLISSAIAVLVGILLGWWMALLTDQQKKKETKQQSVID